MKTARNHIRAVRQTVIMRQILRGNIYKIPFAKKQGIDRSLMFDGKNLDAETIKRMYRYLLPQDSNYDTVKHISSRAFLNRLINNNTKEDSMEVTIERVKKEKMPDSIVVVRGQEYDITDSNYGVALKTIQDVAFLNEHLQAIGSKVTKYNEYQPVGALEIEEIQRLQNQCVSLQILINTAMQEITLDNEETNANKRPRGE